MEVEGGTKGQHARELLMQAPGVILASDNKRLAQIGPGTWSEARVLLK
jgi:hypothetical protein